MNKREENTAGAAIAMVPVIMFVMAVAFAIITESQNTQPDTDRDTPQPSAESGS